MSEKAASKFNAQQRRRARRLILQALYQWQIASTPLNELEAQFRTDNDMEQVDLEYFQELIHGVPSLTSEIDHQLENYLDRPNAELTPIERAILRMGTYELMQRADIPYKVVINEAVELAKTFGATDGHKYVNGILDKLAQKLRYIEIRGQLSPP